MRRLAAVIRLVAVNAAVLLLLLAVVEGLASLLLVGRDTLHARPPSERLHTVHDSELGWVNRANASIADLYGPGLDLHVNPQGFRGTNPTPATVPAGRLRLVCSGDSFTLGYGVADSATWCQRLEARLPGLETVNMGQGGYGFDQAWLWYRRERSWLGDRIQVFAFIDDDFRRMESDRFLGYPRPRVGLRGDSLVVLNLPVPRPATGLAALPGRLASGVRSLRMVELFHRIGTRLGGGSSSQPAAESPADSAARARLRPVVAGMIRDLARWHAVGGSHLLIVRLPTRYELEGRYRQVGDEWGRFVADVARDEGVEYLDLFPTFEAMAPAAWDSLFLGPQPSGFPAASGHYTTAGNAVVAGRVAAVLDSSGWLETPR